MKPINLECWTTKELAEEIKQSISVLEVLRTYAPGATIWQGYGAYSQEQKGRAQCPIHHGQDLNFAFGRDFYHCFVCGAHGDVIKLAQELLCCNFAEAIKRINADFRLGLPLETCEKSAEQSATMRQRQLEAKAKQEARNAYEARHKELYDLYAKYDVAKRNASPFSEEYAEAVKKIDYINYLINSEL